MSKDLNPDKTLIFRIIHRDNFPWIFNNGLHCRNSDVVDPNYVNIGNADLIGRRHYRIVDVPPGGTLSDYVSFYFTPYSPMLYNIKTGYGDVAKRPSAEIVILVSSLHKLKAVGVPFLFTDRHAYLRAAQFFSDLSSLDRIDWPLLQARDFKRDPEDPEKLERYQAEALVHRHVPTHALLGAVCYNEDVAASLRRVSESNGMKFQVIARPGWYP